MKSLPWVVSHPASFVDTSRISLPHSTTFMKMESPILMSSWRTSSYPILPLQSLLILVAQGRSPQTATPFFQHLLVELCITFLQKWLKIKIATHTYRRMLGPLASSFTLHWWEAILSLLANLVPRIKRMMPLFVTESSTVHRIASRRVSPFHQTSDALFMVC